MKIPVISLVFQGIPEQIAIVTLAFVIAKIQLEWKKVILCGVILAATAYILRIFPITFGIHTIILIGLLFFILIQYFQTSLVIALRASLISFSVLIIIEYICYTVLTTLFNISFEAYLSSPIIRTLIGLPQVIIIFMLSYIVLKIRTGREIT